MPLSHARARWLLAAIAIIAVIVVVLTQSSSGRRQAGPTPNPTAKPTSSASTRPSASQPTPSTRPAPTALKVMNYYPANAGWEKLWTEFDSAQIDSDFAAIASLGANTVRIIIQPDAVGYPTLQPVMAGRIAHVVTLAWSHKLRVEFTLFDLWGRYDQIETSSQWVNNLLTPFRNDDRVVMLELQNEINLATPGALVWATRLLSDLQTLAPSIPRTVSVQSGRDGAPVASMLAGPVGPLLSVIDLHLYGTFQQRELALNAAQRYAAGRPIVVGEAGSSTGAKESTTSDNRQAAFYLSLLTQLRDHGIKSFAPWTLDDFTANGVRSGNTNDPQAHYGLRRLDGSYKPAAQVVRLMFTS